MDRLLSVNMDLLNKRTLSIATTVILIARLVLGNRAPYTVQLDDRTTYRHRIFYQRGHSEADLPECSEYNVCNRVDAYATPWIERQCRCPNKAQCPTTLNSDDGHTIVDKSRQFKLCQPVSALPTCRYFKDITWTLTIQPGNTTVQKVNCLCPKHSVAYMFKHQEEESDDGTINSYHFACDPQFRLMCQRKEPCRLFSVKKRMDVEEVNTNTLCQCPHSFHCPEHHTDNHVIFGTAFRQEHIKTYSGYCATQSK